LTEGGGVLYSKYRKDEEKMKNLKYLVFLILSMFVVTANVDAISSETELMTCLSGTEDTCTLTGDVITSTPFDLSDRKVTIDLAGKTLTLGGPVTVLENAELTIDGKGKVTASTIEHLFRVNPTGSLYLKEANYENKTGDAVIVNLYGNTTDTSEKTYLKVEEGASLSANYGIIVKHAGSNASYGVEVDYAGTFQGITENGGYNEGTVGIFVNGKLQKTTGNVPVINITGGSITTVKGTTGDVNDDSAPALAAQGYAIWNISGGKITGTEAIAIKAGKFNITGGTFTATGEYYDPAKSFGNGTEATGAAISITATKNYIGSVDVTISDANVTSKNGHAIYEGISVDSEGNKSVSASALANDGLTIKDGIYTAAEGKAALEIEKELTEFISGGEFSTEVANTYLSSSLSTVVTADGTYVVGEKHKITVSEIENGEVLVDKTEAIVGETVKVTVTAKDGYKVKSVTANGEEVKDNKFIMPNKDVEVKVEFEKVADAPANVTTNPKTGDNVMLYSIIGLMAIIGLGYTLKQKREN